MATNRSHLGGPESSISPDSAQTRAGPGRTDLDFARPLKICPHHFMIAGSTERRLGNRGTVDDEDSSRSLLATSAADQEAAIGYAKRDDWLADVMPVTKAQQPTGSRSGWNFPSREPETRQDS